VAFGVNAGYRFTHPGSPVPNAPVQPVGDQFIAGVAASYLLPHTDTKLIGELFGAVPASRTTSDVDRSSTALELLGGIKHDFTHELAFHAGAGTALSKGNSSPDWRIYTGINFTFGPVFSKRPSLSKPDVDKFTLHIVFDFDSDELAQEYVDALKIVVESISKESFSKIVVEGHTDSVGRAAYNKDLSMRRAARIRQYLIRDSHFPPEKVEASGMGDTVPIADNGNFQGRQENRRVEIRVIK
jgi:outer membrane protein OmpA-like peptidoglycan-associated protein